MQGQENCGTRHIMELRGFFVRPIPFLISCIFCQALYSYYSSGICIFIQIFVFVFWYRNGLETENLSHFGFSFIQRDSECDPLFQSVALQQYILLCSQVCFKLLSLTVASLTVLSTSLCSVIRDGSFLLVIVVTCMIVDPLSHLMLTVWYYL